MTDPSFRVVGPPAATNGSFRLGLNLPPSWRNIQSGMPQNDELALLRQVAAKDRKAFEALYHL
jgi:hypothetical protein